MIYVGIIALTLILILPIVKGTKNMTNYNSSSNSRNYNKQYLKPYKYKYPCGNQNTPYKKRYFLTQNELNFYKKLKPLSDKQNLCVISKIRLADLVEVDTGQTREYNKYFAKIKSKHIDFALAEPKNLEIKCLIELDDSSHNKQDRIERDLFVNNVCSAAGYKLFRTYGDISDIETFIAKKPLKRYI